MIRWMRDCSRRRLYRGVLYIVDASEQCGYTIKQQAELFHSIKPLFANKPLVIAVNKVDQRRRGRSNPLQSTLVSSFVRSFAYSLDLRGT